MSRSPSAPTPESVGPHWLPNALRLSVGLALLAACSNQACADIDPLTGIDFVRIGAVGNAPWSGNGRPGDDAIGRGSVGYEYSIGRFEVTTRQWVDFLNAALDRPAGDQIPYVSVPQFWGGSSTTPNNPGGRRFVVRPGMDMIPVGDITWRMAAVLCNWYSNDRRMDRGAFLNGAYDTSTFGLGPSGFTDQPTHTPGARYWIPSWDEWLKAAHYDPNRNGQGQGGWWAYSNATDTQLVGGPPGAGQANFGFTSGAFNIPLGAYAQTQSPWGLLDVAGATSEWMEGLLERGDRYRIYDGSWWDSTPFYGLADAIFAEGAEFPWIAGYENGLRIASSVPAPSAWTIGVGVCITIVSRRRRG